MDRLGLILTFIWISAFGFIIFFNLKDAEYMHLNEWGDFFAGFAAPLALLWLIIGYRLQKQELAMNRNVLETQQAELSKQVDELAKQNETLQQQNKVLENSIDATNQLARAIEDISSTYDGWQRNG